MKNILQNLNAGEMFTELLRKLVYSSTVQVTIALNCVVTGYEIFLVIMVPVSVDLKLLSPLQCTESFLQPDTRSLSRKKNYFADCSDEHLKKLPKTS